MTAFRDAIARAAGLLTDVHPVIMPNVDDYASADAVLAMPEMVAIRKSLAWLHDAGGPNYLATIFDLPESVMAWVLGEKQ